MVIRTWGWAALSRWSLYSLHLIIQLHQRLVAIHTSDVLSMPQPLLTILQQGGFIVSINAWPWHSVGIDGAHEMLVLNINSLNHLLIVSQLPAIYPTGQEHLRIYSNSCFLQRSITDQHITNITWPRRLHWTFAPDGFPSMWSEFEVASSEVGFGCLRLGYFCWGNFS